MMIYQQAVAFAAEAHKGQTRKYTGAPYVVHPVEVASIVQLVGRIDDEEVLAAAVLHDVVEDTDYSLEDIEAEFGPRVARVVSGLTDVYVLPEYGNRAARKTLERNRLGAEIAEVQDVKVADLISNTRDIVAFDRGFAKVYLKEKRDMLALLTKANHRLTAVAIRTLEAGEASITKG